MSLNRLPGLARPASLDFVAQRRWAPAGLALLLVGALLLGWRWVAHEQLRQRTEAEERDLQQLFRRSSNPAQAMSADDQARHAQIEAVARDLAAPWDSLLSIVEKHAGREVMLRSLEPDAATGGLRLGARAGTLGEMMDFVSALESDPRLRQVMLLGHDPVAALPGVATGAVPGATRPAAIDFSLSATWRADAARPRGSKPPAAPAARPAPTAPRRP